MVGERSGGTGVLAEGGGEACLGDIPAQRLADLAVGIGEEIGRLAELGVEAGRGQREIGPLLGGGQPGHVGVAVRSEEHTSELQSLMRISYAVFCLKKKKKI